MANNSYYLISGEVLPETFKKVLEAKELLAKGEASSSSEAARIAGISRSAFYKYRDFVHAYSGQGAGRIITVSAILKDKPGVLSSFITKISEAGANILTVNQNIPSNGYAAVSVSIRIESNNVSLDSLISSIKTASGVKKIENIMGE